MTIKRFEDIVAWQEGRKLAKLVYELTRVGALSKDFGMRDQIQRAAVSVASNIAEGFERSGNREFAHFLWIAKGSAGETASQLYALLDIGYVTQEQFNSVYECARHCSYLIYRLIESIKNSPVAGERYKTSQPSQTSPTSPTSHTSHTSPTSHTSHTSHTSSSSKCE